MRLSMRSPVIVALAMLVLCACSREQAVTSTEPADATIYTALSIITMDAVRPSATAVAVQGDRIAAVGNIEEVKRALARAGTTWVIDTRFSRKVILPGFIEPHLHPNIAAILLPMEFITPHDWNFPGKSVKGIRGSAAYEARLREVEGQLRGTDDWLWTWGYHHYFHGELNRAILDSVSASRPIIVWHRSFHEIYMNTAALNALDVSAAEVADHHQVDFAAGHFYENGVSLIAPKLRSRLMEPQRYVAALAQTRKIIHAGGITTVSDGAFGALDLEAELQAIIAAGWDSGDTPFRTYLLLDGKSLGAARGHQDTAKLIRFMPRRNQDKVGFLPLSVKLFADGAAYSQLMQMRGGYLDGHSGEWLMTPPELEAAARVYWNAGFQIHVHVNGDRGLDETLNILEKLQLENPRVDHRFTIHHLAYAAPDQAVRLASLGAMVSANPYYVWALADKYAELGLGPARAHNMVPSKSLVDAGVRLAFHSDFLMAPAQPLLLAWAAATRLTAEGHVVGPDQRISLQQALEGITIDAAYQLRKEQEIGSIEVGKMADFTILQHSPFDVRLEQLKDIPIWGTVFEGKIFPLMSGEN